MWVLFSYELCCVGFRIGLSRQTIAELCLSSSWPNTQKKNDSNSGPEALEKTCAAGLNMHCLMIQCPLSLGLVHEQRTSSSYCMKNIIRYIFNASINLSGVPDQQSRCHASVVCRSVHCALQCCPCPCALSRILPKWHSAARNNALDCFWQWEHTDTHQK